jgi:signal peptidase I
MYVTKQLKTQILLGLVLLCTVLINGVLSTHTVYGQSGEACNVEGTSSFDAFIVAEPGTYQVYARLNLPGAEEYARFAVNNIETGGCSVISGATLTSNSWQSVGTFTQNEGFVGLSLLIADQATTQDASGPAVLLVPAQSTCSDPNKCTITYAEQDYSPIPETLSGNFDSLKVAFLRPFNTQAQVDEVTFYQDGLSLYSQDSLSALNMSYVSPGRHEIVTRVTFSDGTALTRTDQVDKESGPVEYFTPFILRNAQTLKNVGFGIGFIIGYVIISAAISNVRARLKWRRTHVASTMKAGSVPEDPSLRFKETQKSQSRRSDIKTLSRSLIIPSAILGLFIILNSWVIGFFTVDGVSMETTLTNKTRQVLLKLPVSFSRLNRGGYTPDRGDVVVFKKEESKLFLASEEKGADSYVVKRVLGLPGERVTLKNGVLNVYPKGSTEPIQVDTDTSWSSVIVPTTWVNIDITLSAGELFVVGDNRVDSVDSRFYGPIKAHQVIGRVLYKHKTGLTPYEAPLDFPQP